MKWKQIFFFGVKGGLPQCKNLGTYAFFCIFCFVGSSKVTSLFSLFYINCEFNRFLHRG